MSERKDDIVIVDVGTVTAPSGLSRVPPPEYAHSPASSAGIPDIRLLKRMTDDLKAKLAD